MAKRRRARKVYKRTWAKSSHLFGAEDQAAPLRHFLRRSDPKPPHRAYVTGDDEGLRRVYLSRRTVKHLGSGGPKRRVKRKGAKRDLLHEWAHVYQSPEVIRDVKGREGGADLFARRHGKKLFGLRPGGGPASYAKPTRRAFKRKYGQKAWKRKQFGSNYGQDPRTIEWWE